MTSSGADPSTRWISSSTDGTTDRSNSPFRITRTTSSSCCTSHANPLATAAQSRGSVREEGDARGEPVYEAAAPDGADLAGAEEAGGRCRADLVLQRPGVVPGA